MVRLNNSYAWLSSILLTVPTYLRSSLFFPKTVNNKIISMKWKHFSFSRTEFWNSQFLLHQKFTFEEEAIVDIHLASTMPLWNTRWNKCIFCSKIPHKLPNKDGAMIVFSSILEKWMAILEKTRFFLFLAELYGISFKFPVIISNLCPYSG